MTIQEIQQLQVGNLIMIGEDDNTMIAIVDRITRLIPVICKDVNQVVRLYEGHYLDFEDMKDGGVGWCTSDNPEFNEKIRPMAPEYFHGIPIPPNFEESTTFICGTTPRPWRPTSSSISIRMNGTTMKASKKIGNLNNI